MIFVIGVLVCCAVCGLLVGLSIIIFPSSIYFEDQEVQE